jgi:AcrR family transcriptional regulator
MLPGDEKPTPRNRLSEADRYLMLREAAEAVFLRKGYAAAHMDDVAQAAGMSKRTLYQSFPSKAALFDAVIEAYIAPLRFDLDLENEPDIAKALSAMLDVAARHLLAPRQIGIFRLIVAEVNRSPELAEAFHRAGPGGGASALERRIAAEMEKGRLRLSNPEHAASILYGMALGSIHSKMLLGLPGPPDEAEIAHRVREAVAVFLHGTAIDSEGPARQ